MENKTSGVAIAALVLGICALVLVWVPVITQLLAIGAIVCGIIGLNKTKPQAGLTGRGMAIAGLVLGAVAFIISLIFVFAFFSVLNPDKLIPDRTIFGVPISNDYNYAELDAQGFTIEFTNYAGTPITLPLTTTVDSEDCSNAVLSGEYNGAPITTNTAIPDGATFSLKWTCSQGIETKKGDRFNADVTFDYLNSETSYPHRVSGTIVATVK